MATQQPYPIRVSVTLNGTAYRGAKIWATDITQTGYVASVEDAHFARTTSNGRCILDVNNFIGSGTYANGDTVRVYCQVGNILTYSDITLDTKTQQTLVTFTIVRKSGLNDGLTSTLDDDQKNAFDNLRGLRPGLKDALT